MDCGKRDCATRERAVGDFLTTLGFTVQLWAGRAAGLPDQVEVRRATRAPPRGEHRQPDPPQGRGAERTAPGSSRLTRF